MDPNIALETLARLLAWLLVAALIVWIAFAVVVRLDLAGRVWSLVGRYLRWRKGK